MKRVSYYIYKHTECDPKKNYIYISGLSAYKNTRYSTGKPKLYAENL